MKLHCLNKCQSAVINYCIWNSRAVTKYVLQKVASTSLFGGMPYPLLKLDVKLQFVDVPLHYESLAVGIEVQ